MNHLLREAAPVSDAGWALLDGEARQRLGTLLGARKLVDFAGPYGWQYSAANLGRVASVAAVPAVGVTVTPRVVRPVLEVRADFSISRAELADHDRGALDVDLSDLDEAARNAAVTESAAVFHGVEEASLHGIAPASPHDPIPFGPDVEAYPRHVAQAVEVLRAVGIGGPYGLALSPQMFTTVIETTEHGGYLMFEHLRHILEGPIVWTPGVRGGVVLSQRGGDFLLECGQDLSIGYAGHDETAVRLYLEESFTLRIATPEAAIWLKP